MKLISTIAGVLLGLIFNVVALNYFFHFFQMPAPPAGSPPQRIATAATAGNPRLTGGRTKSGANGA